MAPGGVLHSSHDISLILPGVVLHSSHDDISFVSPGVVVRRVLLAGDQLLGVEELAVCACAHLDVRDSHSAKQSVGTSEGIFFICYC